jgi:crotonobetainyl-CoA:carnitine CoA-transferase CaiB-like acyl-CoA transferase
MDGVRVVEVAQWWFVPAGVAILADWGADVIKVEHAVSGDPLRGLQVGRDELGGGGDGRNFLFEQTNRGKRSVGVDLGNDRGREVLYELVREADVFVTNYLNTVRAKLRIDVDDLRAVNQQLVYVRGTGQGSKGPDADRGGFDATSSWYRGGFAYVHRPDDSSEAPLIQRPAYGDSLGGLTLAGAVAAALFKRANTGETSVVDVSLLASTLWMLAPDVIASRIHDIPCIPMGDPTTPANPLVNIYATQDGGWIQLAMIQSDRHWPDLVERLGHPELLDDARFMDTASRATNRDQCVAALQAVFETAPLHEWTRRLADAVGVWAALQSPRDVHDDLQVRANGYLSYLTDEDGNEIPVVNAPVQFDEQNLRLVRLAPRLAEHTNEVLRSVLGWDADTIHDLKVVGAIR